MFLWPFVLPLIIFIVAYWKILAVVRRQAKVMTDRRRDKTTSSEPVAGTSGGTTDTANAPATKDDNQRDDNIVEGAVNEAGLGERGQVGNLQYGPKSLSKAQLNVVKTMVYIIVCFTLCWMPLHFVAMSKLISVRQNVGAFF